MKKDKLELMSLLKQRKQVYNHLHRINQKRKKLNQERATLDVQIANLQEHINRAERQAS